MTVRGEEYAQKIEESIREAVERMVADMRSSIDDVRDAVVQQLQAASQSVQADAKSLSIRAQLDQILGQAGDELAPPPPAAPARPDSGSLRSAVRGIEQGKSQVEVLNALLEQTLRFASRAALFIVKGEAFAGWKGAGFAAHGGNDEAVKRFSAGTSDIPELGRLLREETVVATDGAAFASRLGASAPERALLIPMIIKDKVSAALYVDLVRGGDSSFDRAAIELLVFSTGLLIDTLAIRKKIPSPTLSAGEGSDATIVAPAAAPKPVRLATPPPPPAAAPARPAPPPAASDRTMVMPQVPPEPRREAPPAARSFQLETEPPAMSFATTAIPAVQPPKPPPPEPPPSRTGPPKSEGEKVSTQYIPPAGVTGRAGVQQPQTPEAKRHDEAKRFARLLVSEIKLYNEAKIDDGRRNRDIYERMKEDIDRSRQMYEERIPEDVRRQSNYFYDELVRILADGDPDLLGL